MYRLYIIIIIIIIYTMYRLYIMIIIMIIYKCIDYNDISLLIISTKV